MILTKSRIVNLTIMNELLHEYLALVIESAKTVEQATAGGFALYVTQGGPNMGVNIVLYDPSILISSLHARFEKVKGDRVEGGDDDLFDLVFGSNLFDAIDAPIVLGMISMKPDRNDGCWNASVISLSAAEPGYGPMMYDIALKTSPSGKLAPDRQSVTSDAEGVWKYYHDQRADVDFEHFDDVYDPKTTPKEDDCTLHEPYAGDHWLDGAYSMRGGGRDVSELKSRHTAAMTRLIDESESLGIPISQSIAEGTVLMLADKYFESAYGR